MAKEFFAEGYYATKISAQHTRYFIVRHIASRYLAACQQQEAVVAAGRPTANPIGRK
jgi:hypothetical protein